jgi:REP element-mobilizing transposase RayT
MIIAHHALFGAYGFWLPNDPRGSGSHEVFSEPLRAFGPATKVHTRPSQAHRVHDVQWRLTAKRALQFTPVVCNGLQGRAVGRGFAAAIAEAKYVVYACAVMPDHVHVVIAAHARPIRKIVGHLKARATQALNDDGLNPMAACAYADGTRASPWQDHAWDVRIYSAKHLAWEIDYVNRNPVKAGLPAQRWSFVVAPRW